MRGECVRLYSGKRGDVWRIRYQDAKGQLVNETVGRAADGWTRKRAVAALEERRTDVRREGLLRPAAETFAEVAEKWLAEFPEVKDHRRTTRADYRGVVCNHLIPFFGGRRVSSLTASDVNAYVVAKRKAKASLGPQTLNQHMNRLHAIFDLARREGLLRVNPVTDAERPSVPRTRWTILSPGEIGSVLRAFDAMAGETATETERAWRLTAKAMVTTMLYAWLRRGELLGLRWCDVELANPDGPRLHVRRTWVRGHESDPKTDEGTRVVALAAPLADELFRHLERTPYSTPGDRVFCHPTKGSPISSGYFKALVSEALLRAGIERRMREYHDWRHTGITNAAAAGMPPIEIMAMAGHADFKTTERYIDLAGVVFSTSVELLSARFGAETVPNSGSKAALAESETGSVSLVEPEAA